MSQEKKKFAKDLYANDNLISMYRMLNLIIAPPTNSLETVSFVLNIFKEKFF